MNKCLICYKPCTETASNCHPECMRSWFGTSELPEFPYALEDMDRLAREVIRSHVTVPGVQAKLSLFLETLKKNRSRWTLAGLWGNYILKPPVQKFPYMPEIEDLTMHMARFFGISTVPHCLIRLKSGENAYLARRIDRKADGRSVHMEDMCQLTGRLTEHKYRGSMEQVGNAILRYASNPLYDALRFIEVTLFSFLTGNADMHLKNFSLIYSNPGLIQLAPAYDLVATRLLIPEKPDSEEMALTLNGKKSGFKQDDFQSFARTLGLNPKQIQNTWRRFRQALPGALDFIKGGLMPDEQRESYNRLVTERAGRLGLIEE